MHAVFSRHGDRTPKALAPTNLTSLGAEEVYASGRYYRNKYVASDATSPILGLSRDTAALTQLTVTAPVDNVLQSSAQAFLQGLYPPAGSFSTQELRNDTNVTAPLSGYQYIPVNAVSTASSSSNSENNPWLQGGSGCDNAVVSSNNYLSSTEYKASFSQSADFYKSLLPVINSTFAADDASFKNAYAIFDYIHVATIHNQTIPASDLLTDETLFELKVLADLHEWNLAYNSSDSIRAIAGARWPGRSSRRSTTPSSATASSPCTSSSAPTGASRPSSGSRSCPLCPTTSPASSTTRRRWPSSSSPTRASATATRARRHLGPIPVLQRLRRRRRPHGVPAVRPAGDGPALGHLRVRDQRGRHRRHARLVPRLRRHHRRVRERVHGLRLRLRRVGYQSGKRQRHLPSRSGRHRRLVTLAVVLGAEALIYFLSGVTLVKKSTLAASVAATTPGTKA